MNLERGKEFLTKKNNYVKTITCASLLLFNTINANAQSNLKELIEKDGFKKEINTNETFKGIDLITFKDSENNLVQFKENTGNILHTELSKKMKKEGGFVKVLTYENKERFTKGEKLEYLYDTYAKHKHKIQDIIVSKEINNEKDFDKIRIQANGKELYLTDMKLEGYIHLSKNDDFRNMLKVIRNLKSLPDDKKVVLVFNKDYTFGAFFFIKKDDIENKGIKLENTLEKVKKDIDAINLSAISLPGYRFENKTEEQLAKIYYYVVNNFEYCNSCISAKGNEYGRKEGFNGIDIFDTKTGVCDAYSKAFAYIAEAYGIKVKREIGVIKLPGNVAGDHAWISTVINGKEYYFDPTNEKIITENGRMKPFGKTNLYKVPSDLAQGFLSPNISSYEYIYDKQKEKEFIAKNKERILKDRNEGRPSIFHYMGRYKEMLGI